MAALARAIIWREAAAASAESAVRPAPAAGGRPAAGTAWQSGGPAAAAGGPATAGSPAGQRRPIGGPEAAGSARQSRTAVRRQRTRRGTECHGPFESVGPP